MIPPITLILADDMDQGREVMKECKLNPDSCAVLTQPAYMHKIKLYSNETIYVHAKASTYLFDRLNTEILEGNYSNINIKIINP